MMIEIEEDKKYQQGSPAWDKLMTPEQRKRGEYYSTKYHIRRGEIDAEYKELWDYLQKLYENRRDPVADDEDFPNNFIPLITPTVEGQVASMLEADVDFRHLSDDPMHRTMMKKLDAASEYYRRKTHFKQHFKDFARYYDLLGNCWVTISWEEAYGHSQASPSGFPRIEIPPVLSVLVDGNIKDSKDLQYAEYIIREVGNLSVSWARKEYGDEYADALLAGYNRKEGDGEEAEDETESFMLLQVWTRDNPKHNLQLIEMDANGLIFFESDPDKPYYKHVCNEYPFGIARMIPKLGRFYGFGDGVLLKPLQEGVNNLADELELAARFSAQSKTYVDPDARIAVDQFTSNPADPIFAKDPRNNILSLPGTGVNPVILQTIQFYLQQAQAATRFHDIMTGTQQGTSATATQISTQINQGYVGIKDKKTDLSEVMAWADMYALKLCMEYWDKSFWAGVSENSSEYVDMAELESATMSVPTSLKTLKDKYISKDALGLPPAPADYFETAKKDGEPIKAEIDFYTKVVIGENMPKGRIDMYNILLGLSQIQLVNSDGSTEPLITPDRFRELMEDILGLKMETTEEQSGSINTQTFDIQSLLQQNPVGNENTVQTPQATPSNLQGTVPQMPSGDSRGVVL